MSPQIVASKDQAAREKPSAPRLSRSRSGIECSDSSDEASGYRCGGLDATRRESNKGSC